MTDSGRPKKSVADAEHATDTIVALNIQKEVARQAQSPSWLAKQTGIDEETIRLGLDGRGRFTPKQLQLIAENLGCAMETLFQVATDHSR